MHRTFSLRSNRYHNLLHTTHLVKLELLTTLTKLNFISIESPRIINAGLESGGSEVC